MARRYPSRVLRDELEALGVPRDAHDLAALSARFGFRLEPFQDMEPDTVARLLISALRRRARTPKAMMPGFPLPPRRTH